MLVNLGYLVFRSVLQQVLPLSLIHCPRFKHLQSYVGDKKKKCSINMLCSRWEGSGVDEVGKDSETGHVRVKVNTKYYRPADVVGNF